MVVSSCWRSREYGLCPPATGLRRSAVPSLRKKPKVFLLRSALTLIVAAGHRPYSLVRCRDNTLF